MHLLALTTDAFGGRGGIAQYNRDLLRALALAGGQALVLVRHGSAAGCELPPGIRQLERKGKLAFTLAGLRAAAMGGRFDAVFCGHIHLAPLAATVAAVRGAPLWLQLHGSEAWRPLSRAQRRAVRSAALITAVSRHTRRRFLALCAVDPARVRVLPDTVGARFGPGPKPERLIKRYDLCGRKVLLTVGRLAAAEREKGHDRVIEALPRLVAAEPGLVYLVVGDGDDRARLAELARRLGVGERVRFAGAVPAAELPDYYRTADLFVMPSTQEGFGIVFLEAAASGLRVIAGDRDGSADALADGALGEMIDPTDRDALAAAIRRALSAPAPNPALARRFRFENFAAHLAALTSSHLLRGETA